MTDRVRLLPFLLVAAACTGSDPTSPDPAEAIAALEAASNRILMGLSGPDVREVGAFEAFELGAVLYDDGDQLYNSALNMYAADTPPTPSDMALTNVTSSFTWHRAFNQNVSAMLALEKVPVAELGVQAAFEDGRVDKLEVSLGYTETRTRSLPNGFDDKTAFEASRASIPGNAVVVASLEARTRFAYTAFDADDQSIDIALEVIVPNVNEKVGGSWVMGSKEETGKNFIIESASEASQFAVRVLPIDPAKQDQQYLEQLGALNESATGQRVAEISHLQDRVADVVFRRVEGEAVSWEGLVIGRAETNLQFDLNLRVERSVAPRPGDPTFQACTSGTRFNVPCLAPGQSHRLPGPVSTCPVEARFAFVAATPSNVRECN